MPWLVYSFSTREKMIHTPLPANIFRASGYGPTSTKSNSFSTPSTILSLPSWFTGLTCQNISCIVHVVVINQKSAPAVHSLPSTLPNSRDERGKEYMGRLERNRGWWGGEGGEAEHGRGRTLWVQLERVRNCCNKVGAFSDLWFDSFIRGEICQFQIQGR